jgi:hypothetical protein
MLSWHNLNKNKMRENRHDNYRERDRDSHSPANELVKKEQDYRHKWQDKFLKSHTFTFRLGQIFGLVYNLAVLCITYKLIQNGEKSLALKLFFGNLALMAFAILVTTVERKVLSKKPARKGRDNNKRFNNKGRSNNNRSERPNNRDR